MENVGVALGGEAPELLGRGFPLYKLRSAAAN
ncbi:hypothetical protein MycrhN_4321 [Mycolicibacterium rhodesiae NBB3]|jgi:hypothetical protein|uniref:Uncharacterized protein n=1 Tax=Mycolicibacterium rhodesiae (strain NBB3) TaxID=710685 RepID=G8RKN0_MYCRN|nr:hypothetical protein MycrhN_4321 [Mycolicibacterium rhodesiae NBB3]